MKRPTSVGDLQKGERYVSIRFGIVSTPLKSHVRYVNMDYMFLSSLQNHTLLEVVASYDIACQWTRRLFERMARYGWKITYDERDVTYLFLIPKFHLPAHQESCQTSFSFNLLPKVGRTDGEAPERGWFFVDPLATSTREMGPGSRRDVLDDSFGDYNWQKICRMRESSRTTSVLLQQLTIFKPLHSSAKLRKPSSRRVIMQRNSKSSLLLYQLIK